MLSKWEEPIINRWHYVAFNATVVATLTLPPRVWWQTSHLHLLGRINPESMHFQFHTALATTVGPTHPNKNSFSLKDETTKEGKIPYLVVHTYMPSNYLQH
jgi:hypothetical protein